MTATMTMPATTQITVVEVSVVVTVVLGVVTVSVVKVDDVVDVVDDVVDVVDDVVDVVDDEDGAVVVTTPFWAVSVYSPISRPLFDTGVTAAPSSGCVTGA